MTTCYIGIGSNLGDRQRYIDKALEALKTRKNISVTRVSSIYETEPVSDIPQGRYLNGVIEIDTSLPAGVLMKELLAIEAGFGRKRSAKDGPRTIDLDILYYGEENIREEGLTIPHPKIRAREFVLKGLRELGRA